MNSRTTSWSIPPALPELRIDDVHVWRVTLEQPDAIVQAALELLSRDERERAAWFRFQEDRRKFIVARGALRSMLSGYALRTPAELRFSYSPRGKPALSDASGEPSLRFNISHTHELALFAFSRGREVGIDLEYMRENLAAERIAERTFSPLEVASLRQLPVSQRTRGFFDCWTRKEAYIKARGDGLSMPLNQFTVSLAPDEPAALLSSGYDPREVSRWSLKVLSPGSGYVAALAVEGQGWQLSSWRWDGTF
jgi:4'-phosphopantetheinyl transferase